MKYRVTVITRISAISYDFKTIEGAQSIAKHALRENEVRQVTISKIK